MILLVLLLCPDNDDAAYDDEAGLSTAQVCVLQNSCLLSGHCQQLIFSKDCIAMMISAAYNMILIE